ncbi:factor activating pos9 [Lignoscripta atroalba]|nr:factor activating pos9 [Lignoscripta atroalba]
MPRKNPNIIVTGTPGVGKTSHCELLAQNTGLKHLSINKIVKERQCHDAWDEDFKSWIVDEDKVRLSRARQIMAAVASNRTVLQLLDSIEDEVIQGGNIIDWHACDLFPQSWIDLVVVLRTDSAQLYDRLKARDYAEAKLQENMDSEIMEVLLSEAREAYDGGIVVELRSNESDDIETNVERIESWIQQWKQDQAHATT